jgi:GrpB-like predicted nucleotidyltransferase (UPF0157 family)
VSERPDPNERVAIVDYDPDWPRLYEEESARLSAALGDVLIEAQHIGSTAVPGLAAKPIIDVLAGLRTLDLTTDNIAAVEALGYEYLGEYGIPGRLFFRKGRPRSHHVHAVLFGSDLWERHLALRDYLRARPDEAASYADFKRRLALEVEGDRDRYTDGKEACVSAMEQRARAWDHPRVA